MDVSVSEARSLGVVFRHGDVLFGKFGEYVVGESLSVEALNYNCWNDLIVKDVEKFLNRKAMKVIDVTMEMKNLLNTLETMSEQELQYFKQNTQHHIEAVLDFLKGD